MGWWGHGPVDGDGPWDIIDTIEAECGASALDFKSDGSEIEFHKLPHHEREALFAAKRAAIQKWSPQQMADVCSGIETDDTILITIGFLFLKWQLTLPEDFKAQVLDAIDRDDPNYFNDVEGRTADMALFRQAVVKDDGDGLKHRGLFWEGQLDPRTLFD